MQIWTFKFVWNVMFRWYFQLCYWRES